jgi:hypothetical protein
MRLVHRPKFELAPQATRLVVSLVSQVSLALLGDANKQRRSMLAVTPSVFMGVFTETRVITHT